MYSNEIQVASTIIFTHDDGTKTEFVRHEELGRGTFGVVYRVTDKETNKDYAIKAFSKEKYDGPKNKKRLIKLKREFTIQNSLNHPNIVRSYDFFSDDLNYYMLLEYCPGGTVRTLMKKRAKGCFSEQDTRKILKDVVYGITYLHKNHIIHRDLKLTNYMIGSDGNVKIADFGLSNILENVNEKRFTICGTPAYTSPELLQHKNNGHSYEVDIWAIGVSAFSMLTGRHPFEGAKREIIYENIRKCEYKFPSKIPISLKAKNFIITIFKIDPKWRPSALTLANHPFLATDDQQIKSIIRPNNDSIQNNISSDNESKTQSNIPAPVRPCDFIVIKEDAKLQKEEKIEDEKEIINNIQNQKSNFKIPNYFVSKYLLHDKDLCYLLLDGTVGACFEDQSRMIMDPNEKFIQYYKNYGCYPKLLNPDDYLDKKTKLSRKIKLFKKFA